MLLFVLISMKEFHPFFDKRAPASVISLSITSAQRWFKDLLMYVTLIKLECSGARYLKVDVSEFN